MMHHHTETESAVVQGGVTSLLLLYVNQAISFMIPFLVLSLILILVDLLFGIEASKKRYEYSHSETDRVRPSRALRKTINKIFEYACWVILSASLAVSFDVEWINMAVMAFIVANEMISVVDNYMYVHDKKITGLKEFFLKLIGKKMNIDTSDIKITDKNETTT